MRNFTLLLILYILIIVIIIIFVYSTTNERNYWKRALPIQTCPFGKEISTVVRTEGNQNVPEEAAGIVSYSLFGNYEKYSITLLESIPNIQKLLPNWYARVYVGKDIPISILNDLVSQGAQVYIMGPVPVGFEAALWRYLPAGELLPFVSLDADDLFDTCIANSIESWLRSGKTFANFSPHAFVVPMAAGLWGSRPINDGGVNTPSIPEIGNLLDSYCEHWFGFDEAFLKHNVWPLFKQHGYYQVKNYHLRELFILLIVVLVIMMIVSLNKAYKVNT